MLCSGYVIRSKQSLRYLGVQFDKKLDLRKHVDLREPTMWQ